VTALAPVQCPMGGTGESSGYTVMGNEGMSARLERISDGSKEVSASVESTAEARERLVGDIYGRARDVHGRAEEVEASVEDVKGSAGVVEASVGVVEGSVAVVEGWLEVDEGSVGVGRRQVGGR
jgi:methyl-accepting chemotaxis protein